MTLVQRWVVGCAGARARPSLQLLTPPSGVRSVSRQAKPPNSDFANCIDGLVGSLLGFLLWNCRPAKEFLVEVGTTFLGRGVCLCCPRRFLAGQRVFQAHRLHLFQRLHQAGPGCLAWLLWSCWLGCGWISVWRRHLLWRPRADATPLVEPLAHHRQHRWLAGASGRCSQTVAVRFVGRQLHMDPRGAPHCLPQRSGLRPRERCSFHASFLVRDLSCGSQMD